MEWRWKTPKFLSQQRHFLQPIWDGKEDLNDKRILIWYEQGIGDTLNWSFLLPFIASGQACYPGVSGKINSTINTFISRYRD